MASAAKRRVYYTDLGRCVEGDSARVYIRGQGWFRTTPVLEITPHCDGLVFETLNSFYWPAPTDGTPLETTYKYSEKRHVPHCEV